MGKFRIQAVAPHPVGFHDLYDQQITLDPGESAEIEADSLDDILESPIRVLVDRRFVQVTAVLPRSSGSAQRKPAPAKEREETESTE